MPALNIRSKLFIAIFLACALVVTSAAGLFHFRVQKAFQEYRQTLDNIYLDNLVNELENYYLTYGDWSALQNFRNWRRLLRANARQTRRQGIPRPPRNQLGSGEHPSPGRTTFRTVLYDENKQYIQGRQETTFPKLFRPLHVSDQIVGYLGIYKRPRRHGSNEDTRFLNTQNETLIMVALLTIVSSFLIAFLLSRQLVKPIRFLRNSTRELASGDYSARIPSHSGDELGLLSQDFNKLAENLQQHEQSRRQWIMDIAHELRTPLAILRGEIEAIQDGISPADPQNIQSLHQETLHLQRLVDDLYTLSLSDNGSLTYQHLHLDMVALLADTLAQFDALLHEKQLTLSTELPGQPVMVSGDPQRLQQLFQNLLKNSVRYTESPGQLLITLSHDPQQITLTFADSAPGVPDNSLPRLFERLYRVESSRNRATGGAGIGLSICHNIVQAHSGTITASHADIGGLKITVKLPAA